MNLHEPVRHVMSHDPVHIGVEDAPSKARKLLSDGPFHHLPVVQGKALVGMLSVADLKPLTLEAYVGDSGAVDAYLDGQFTVTGIMTHEPATVTPDSTVKEAAEVLAEGAFHALPVVDDQGHLVGVITSTDLLRFIVRGG